MFKETIEESELPCMTENHEVYIAGKGYVKVKDCLPGDEIINEINGKTNRVKISNIKLISNGLIKLELIS